MKVVGCAIHDDRVARIVPSLASCAHIRIVAQNIDQLALAFVALYLSTRVTRTPPTHWDPSTTVAVILLAGYLVE